jgi:hypothetical protein
VLSSELELAALRDSDFLARVRGFNDGMVAELAVVVPRLVEFAGHPPTLEPVAAARSLVALFRGLAAGVLLNGTTAPQAADAKKLVNAVLGAYSSDPETSGT